MPSQQIAQPAPDADFVGTYNGNSFETAMGMRIAADGTYQWGLSVGGLDMRSAGTWQQQDGRITLTTLPKPIAPEFRWSGYEKVPGGLLVKVITPAGKAFGFADIRVACANGEIIYDQVPREGWSPPADKCDAPRTLMLRIPSYNVESEEYDLVNTFQVRPGETIRFEFHRNDMGVADFTGMVGSLQHNELNLTGAEWPMTLRKNPSPQAEP